MNIKILDSWMRDHLKTKATAHEIAKAMSLTSVSIERMEEHKKDFIFDIEITTNRPDLMSVIGLAREAAAILPHNGHEAEFISPKITKPSPVKNNVSLEIISDDLLVNRMCAAVLDVTLKNSPEFISERLETSGIRSLNNIVDVTNYIMRTIGHTAHVFDYDRIKGHSITIREAKKGESITTIDGKTYILEGGDIIAVDKEGNIIDLLGIMGLENSVVTENTKRIVLFINNNNTHKMRQTSMRHNIRTEAVQMNEKGLDPELALEALYFGISLYEEIAEGKLMAPIIDIYPHKKSTENVTVSLSEIQRIMGIPLSLTESQKILNQLGFKTTVTKETLTAIVPSYRADDITIPEDLIEEVARVYGYHNLPSILPPVVSIDPVSIENDIFRWETRVKNALKYWGFTEVYTYPMVSEDMYEGPLESAVALSNPLGEEFVYMRRTLIPNLLRVVEDNRNVDALHLFEIANIYEAREKDLPKEIRTLALVIKNKTKDYFDMKGVIEQLAQDCGINNLTFGTGGSTSLETRIYLGKNEIGRMEILDEHFINAEINFDLFLSHVSIKKTYTKLSKFPSVFEDITLIGNNKATHEVIVETIKNTSKLVRAVTLSSKFKDARTYHIEYQDKEKNLSSNDVKEIRENILSSLHKNLSLQEK